MPRGRPNRTRPLKAKPNSKGKGKRKSESQSRTRLGRSGERLRRLSYALPGLGLGLAAVAVFAVGWLEPYVWLGVVVSELSIPLALASLPLTGWLAYRRRWAGAALCATAAIWAASSAWSFVRPTRPTPGLGPELRVAQVHAHGATISPGALARFVVQADLDVLSITDTNPALSQAPPGYRAAFSRVPEGARQALLVRNRSWGGAERDLVTLHVGRCDVLLHPAQLPSALDPRARETRRAAIERLVARPRVPRSIWLGHLGSKSNLSDLEPLRQRHELRDARRGQGRLATAPAWLGPFGFLHDHVLLHGFIAVVHAETLAPPVAAFDRVLVADLALTEPDCASRRAAASP